MGQVCHRVLPFCTCDMPFWLNLIMYSDHMEYEEFKQNATNFSQAV